jgi:CHAT domain-containing protein/tetratricopeptide (TPR) repeat protein
VLKRRFIFFLIVILSFSSYLIAQDPASQRDLLIQKAYQLHRETNFKEERKVVDLLLEVSTSTNDKIGIASAQLLSGILNRELDNVDAAFKDFESSLQLSESMNYTKGIAEALDYMAWLKKDVGENEEASKLVQRSFELYTQLSDKKGIGRTIGLMGDLAAAAADHKKALELYAQSLKVREELGDSTEIGKALVRMGMSQGALGNFDTSLEYYRKAQALFLKAGTKLDLMSVTNNIANNIKARGHLSQALEYYLDVLRMAEEVGIKRWIALPTINIGVLHENLGNYKVAMEYYQKAYALYEETGMKWFSVVALSNIAGIHAYEGRYDESLKVYNQALSKYEALNSKGSVASILGNIAYVYELKGDYQTALQYCQKSLDQLEKLNQKENLADTMVLLARIQRQQKLYDQALQSATKAKELALTEGWVDIIWPAYMEEGRAYRELGNQKRALNSFEESVRFVESLRTEVPGMETSASNFFQARTEPYYDLIQELILQNQNETAFKYAELSKARALLDVLESGKDAITKSMTEKEKEEEKTLKSELVSLNKKIMEEKGKTNGKFSVVEEQLNKVRANFESFRNNLYSSHPELQIHRGMIAVVAPSEAIKSIKEKTAVLEYVVAEDQTFLFVLTASDFEVHSIKVSKKELSKLASDLRQQVGNLDLGYRTLSQQIYKLLLKPAENRLRSVNSIIIIPDGEVWELPFQMLENSQGKYLLETYAISYAPSLTALIKMIDSELDSEISSTLLAIGNPDLADETADRLEAEQRGNRYSLPIAEDEVQALANLYGKSSAVYVRSNASEDTFKTEANKYGVIHIAAHGILNDVDPLYSHLALARKNSEDDGLLEPWEIMDLDLKARMVVLSACETGRGKVSTGEGIIGFAWSFFIAGSPSIVVSQWKVDSRSTTLLMREFHSNWRTKQTSKAEALRKAGLKLMQDPAYKHPYYWAAFLVVGDPS